MKLKFALPRPAGLVILLALAALFVWWIWTSVGFTGELRPRSVARVLFLVWTSTAFHTTGYTWAREGDRIVLDYDVTLESGYFSLTVGKTRWPHRLLLRHEERRSFRRSASGQLVYTVRQSGLHAIWAGRYSVWRGEASVRWTVRRGSS
jgi:hypothetical protein